MHPSIKSSHIRKLGGVESTPQKAHRQQSGHYDVRHALITNLPTNDKFTMLQPVLCGVSFNEQHSPQNTLSICAAPTSTYSNLFKQVVQWPELINRMGSFDQYLKWYDVNSEKQTVNKHFNNTFSI